MQKIVACLLFISFSLFAIAQNGKDPVKVTDMTKIKSVGSINLSKDGSKAVFTVLSIEPDGDSKLEYKYGTQLWMVNTDGNSMPRQLTTKENSSQPVFSPDGKQVLFVRPVDGKSQLFLLSLDGGEAVQLTKFRYGAGSPKWSPDGKQIVFTTSVPLKDWMKDTLLNPGKEVPKWPLEKPGFDKNQQLKAGTAKADPDGSMEEIRAYLDNNANDKKAKVLNRLTIQDEMDVNPDQSVNCIFIMDARADAKPIKLIKGLYNSSVAEFTPDSKRLIIGADIDSTESPDRSLESELFIVDADGTNLHQILGEAGKTFTSPRISPSGKWLAFLSGSTSFVEVPVLNVVSLYGNYDDRLAIPFDRSKGNIIWSADDKYLYFTAQSNGGQPLYRVEVSKGMGVYPPTLSSFSGSTKVEQLTDYNSGIINYDLANNKIVFVKTEVADPFELYLADATGKNQKRISSFNTDWIAGKKLSSPEKNSFKNEKGLDIEYWVMKPTNFEPGKKYPLLLNIHGGPSAMWGPGETSMWHEFQFFCSKGYGVVYCNPRGSGGYGVDFLRANINDWGTGPTSDVLTALDKTVAEGWADTSKLMVTGGSYAGYLVAWIIAHDHRFKAACSQRGVYDLATFFGEGNAWRLVPNYFGGYPWEPATKAILQRESPITYVQNITTPYIIFHGDNDRRTGFVQSEMLYRSLKVLGRSVEYVRHPGGTHELTRSGNNRQRIDQMLRTYEFFERWIR